MLIGALALLHDRVVQRLEIAQTVELGDVRPDRIQIQRFADQRLHLGQNGLLVTPRLRVDANESDHRQTRLPGRAPRHVGLVRPVIHSQRREPRLDTASRGLALRDHARRDREIRRRGGAQRRLDQNVPGCQGRLLPIRVFAHQDGQHLIRDGQGRIEFVARQQRKAHIRHDENVRLHRPRHVDRQVFGQTAVDQQSSAIIDRCEDAGGGDARPHGDRQVSALHQNRRAGFQIRRHCAKGCRKLIEIGGVAERQSELPQRLLQFLALNEALGQEDVIVLETQGQANQEIAVILFAPEVQIPARRRVAERLLPIHRTHGGFDLCSRHAARIQAAHHGAHAGAGDAVDGYLQLLDDPEHPDVRHAAGAAARQHQADAGMGGRRQTLGRRRLRLCTVDHAPSANCDQRPGQSKSKTAVPHHGGTV